MDQFRRKTARYNNGVNGKYQDGLKVCTVVVGLKTNLHMIPIWLLVQLHMYKLPTLELINSTIKETQTTSIHL